MRIQLACTLALAASTAGTLASVPYRPPVGAEFEHIPLVPPEPSSADSVGYSVPIDRFVIRWPRVAVQATGVFEFDMRSRTSRRLSGNTATYQYPPTNSLQSNDMLVEPLGYVGQDIAFLTGMNRVILLNENGAYSPFAQNENYSIPRVSGRHGADTDAIYAAASSFPGQTPLGVIRKSVGQPAAVVIPPAGRPRNATFTYTSIADVRASGQAVLFRARVAGSLDHKLMFLKNSQPVDVGTLITAQTGLTVLDVYSYGGDGDTWFAVCSLLPPASGSAPNDTIIKLRLATESVQILPLTLVNPEVLGPGTITAIVPLELRASGSIAVIPFRYSTVVNGAPEVRRHYALYDGTSFRAITGKDPWQLAPYVSDWRDSSRSIEGDRFILPMQPFTLSRYIPPDQRRRCHVDIANDRAEDLVEGRSTNSGITEADYNFFMAHFFDADPACDLAYDNGTPFTYPNPPTTRGLVNNGVTEADYNVFFSQFFQPCP
jgi:hypothetical protein